MTLSLCVFVFKFWSCLSLQVLTNPDEKLKILFWFYVLIIMLNKIFCFLSLEWELLLVRVAHGAGDTQTWFISQDKGSHKIFQLGIYQGWNIFLTSASFLFFWNRTPTVDNKWNQMPTFQIEYRVELCSLKSLNIQSINM